MCYPACLQQSGWCNACSAGTEAQLDCDWGEVHLNKIIYLYHVIMYQAAPRYFTVRWLDAETLVKCCPTFNEGPLKMWACSILCYSVNLALSRTLRCSHPSKNNLQIYSRGSTPLITRCYGKLTNHLLSHKSPIISKQSWNIIHRNRQKANCFLCAMKPCTHSSLNCSGVTSTYLIHNLWDQEILTFLPLR